MPRRRILGPVRPIIIVPHISLDIIAIVHFHFDRRLGLFVLGCCPGGTGSNFWTLLLDGDINLSISMTFISTLAAMGMMPLWMFVMGPVLTDGKLIIPFAELIMSLVGKSDF